MDTEGPVRSGVITLLALARALGIAVLSLAIGSALCLGLLLGGTALAAS